MASDQAVETSAVEAQAGAVERPSRTAVSLAVPLVGSLLQTAGVVWLCGTPWHGTLGWSQLFSRALVFVAVGILAHGGAVWTNRRLFPAQVDAPGRLLLLASWPAVVWIPLLVLLIREESILSVAVLALVSASATSAVHHWAVGGGDTRLEAARKPAGPFRFTTEAPGRFLRAMAPAVATSTLLHGAVGELAAKNVLRAGLLLAGGLVWPVWSYRAGGETGAGESRPVGVRALLSRTLLVYVLLVIALMPYLKTGGTPGAMAVLLRSGNAGGSAPKTAEARAGVTHRGSYTGIVLVLPPQKRRPELVPPMPVEHSRDISGEARPMLIPFDGPYWYFKEPDERPRADAPVVRGDPVKVDIRSTDEVPLQMEAHQRLRRRVAMSCCSAVRVLLRNADERPGAIAVQVFLRDSSLSRPPEASPVRVSLGTLVLLSSVDGEVARRRAPVEEALRFPFPRAVRGGQFDEITVAIRPAWRAGHAAAHVAVGSFELLP